LRWRSAFSGATGAVLWTSHLTGEMNLGLGYGLATCGDADGDGVVDLLAASTGIALEGYATWLSGADGSLVSSYGSYLLGLGRRVGAAPAALWDLGGGPRPGVAFTGSVGNTVLLWSVEGPAPFSSLQPPADPEAGFGLALAGGDFDGDGRLDLAVGAPDADSGAAGAGRVRVYPRVGP